MQLMLISASGQAFELMANKGPAPATTFPSSFPPYLRTNCLAKALAKINNMQECLARRHFHHGNCPSSL